MTPMDYTILAISLMMPTAYGMALLLGIILPRKHD